MNRATAAIQSSGDRQDPVSAESWLRYVVVIIPALNEERALPRVLRDLPPVGAVIVVDNGSTDRTAAVAQSQQATVAREDRRGYGAACLRGITVMDELRARRSIEPRVVVFLDGDYSDHPDLLPELVRPIFEGRADFVLGSRLRGSRESGAMPAAAVLGNRLACALMWLFFGVRYTDLGPFRAISLAALRKLDMQDRDFGWTVEMQIKAARHQLRTVELPVPYRCRVGESKISGTMTGSLRAGAKILYVIARHLARTHSVAGRGA